MIINANTKIAAIIKAQPEALEAIIGISGRFAKLRNPILRKVIGGRTSIAMASKVGGCNVEDFFKQLEPLGFNIDRKTAAIEEKNHEPVQVHGFMKSLAVEEVTILDVRPVIESGKDPLQLILQHVKQIKEGGVLKIINSFEPSPLIRLLSSQGFESYSQKINEELVHTYFHKSAGQALTNEKQLAFSEQDWNAIATRFENNIETVDVKELPMPLPMHTILDALDKLPVAKALLVYHKRIPVFLLPELEARQFDYRVKEISDTEVQLLIYKN